MKMTIYSLIRHQDHYDKILGKLTLRVINVTSSFIGIGDNGEPNLAEFQRLADSLEPGNEGFTLQ